MYQIKFKSRKFLFFATEWLEHYAPASLDDVMKPKRYSQLKAAFSPLYTMNDGGLLRLKEVIRQDILISDHGLAQNGVILETLPHDYRRCVDLAKGLAPRMKPLKQFDELALYLKTMEGVLNPKSYVDCFVSDLKDLQEGLGWKTLDIKEFVSKVK